MPPKSDLGWINDWLRPKTKKDNSMKITVEHYSETITVETPEEITADDFVDLLYRLGIMVGYQEQSMSDACAELEKRITKQHDDLACHASGFPLGSPSHFKYHVSKA